MTFENSAPGTEVTFKNSGQKHTWLRGPPDENGWFQLKNQESKKCLAAERDTRFTIQGNNITLYAMIRSHWLYRFLEGEKTSRF